MLASRTIGIGIALIILGLVGFFATHMVSVTALIPAFFGVVLALLGALARDPRKRKLVMHIAVAVGLAGFLGSVSGLGRVARLVAGGQIQRPAAAIAQSIMAVLLGVFVAWCVKSFIDARRQPPAA
jgi:hypothetical protein